MQGTEKTFLGSLTTRAKMGFLALLMLFSVLGGCATVSKEQALPAPEPAPVVMEKPAKRPTVTRFEEGREGFVVTEFPAADGTMRRDFDRAVAMLEDEDYEGAIALLEKVIERSPGVTAPYIDIAIAYRHTGSPDLAEESLKTALELFPEHPVIFNEYGLLYRETGRFPEAKAMYQMVIERYPEYYPAHRNLGILCDLYLNDLSCALEHYEIYSEARPDDEQVKLWIADLSARLGPN